MPASALLKKVTPRETAAVRSELLRPWTRFATTGAQTAAPTMPAMRKIKPPAVAAKKREAKLRAEHHRAEAAELRAIADREPLPSVRRHLRRLAAQHDEVAEGHNRHLRSRPS